MFMVDGITGAALFLIVQWDTDQNVRQCVGVLVGFAIAAGHTVILECVGTVRKLNGIEVHLNGCQ